MSSNNEDLGVYSSSEIDLESSHRVARPGQTRLGSDGMTYPVAFFHFAFNDSNGCGLGGMLVTDNTGIPLEFIVTTAVKTTVAQRLLYGKRLRSFIAVNLCAKQLLQNVKTKPRVIFVEHDWLLAIHEQTDIPILQLIPTEQLDGPQGRPTVMPPDLHPEYADVLDLTSLDADMADAFDRIEACRKVLSQKNPEYNI